MDYSSLITDNCLNDLISFKHLLQLHIFHSSLSLAGKARIIVNLLQLRVLARGDSLCDALDLIEEEMDTDLIGTLNSGPQRSITFMTASKCN